MPNCPQCRNPLEKVRRGSNSPLNEEQFDAIKAGDWFCKKCPSNSRSKSPFAYFWDSEISSGNLTGGFSSTEEKSNTPKSVQSRCCPIKSIEFIWAQSGIGFGRFVFSTENENGICKIDNEGMSKDFIKQMLCKMVDDAELTG